MNPETIKSTARLMGRTLTLLFIAYFILVPVLVFILDLFQSWGSAHRSEIVWGAVLLAVLAGIFFPSQKPQRKK
jgi:ACR3 family arsenite efflux pump ArsB